MKWARTLLLLTLPLLVGCVTVADHRKLQREVINLKHEGANRGGPAPRERMADLAARIDVLEQEIEMLNGRLEVTEHRSDQAVREARQARQTAATQGVNNPEGMAGAPPLAAQAGPDGSANPNIALSEELVAYKAARSRWSRSDWEACVDHLGDFLQTYPSSVYADDAAYWRADCYFQQGEYKKAILRFDDVVSRYPKGNKAADALYREGEALVRMGPGFNKAAHKAFERVRAEYPDSDRAAEAQQQIELLKTD
jgi:tol-pal system protein YbgF